MCCACHRAVAAPRVALESAGGVEGEAHSAGSPEAQTQAPRNQQPVHLSPLNSPGLDSHHFRWRMQAKVLFLCMGWSKVGLCSDRCQSTSQPGLTLPTVFILLQGSKELGKFQGKWNRETETEKLKQGKTIGSQLVTNKPLSSSAKDTRANG